MKVQEVVDLSWIQNGLIFQSGEVITTVFMCAAGSCCKITGKINSKKSQLPFISAYISQLKGYHGQGNPSKFNSIRQRPNRSFQPARITNFINMIFG